MPSRDSPGIARGFRMLAQFRGGFERIVWGTDYPIIPVYSGGAWALPKRARLCRAPREANGAKAPGSIDT